MKRWKPLVYYLLLNVIVSACVTLAVLWIWDYTHQPSLPGAAQDLTPAATLDSTAAAVGSLTTPVTTPITVTATVPAIEIPQNVEQYEVEPGDTLGLISDKFDVSVEQLLQLNQINDPDALSVGMIIYIPLPGGAVSTPVASPTRAVTAGPTGTPSGPPVDARVIINSVIGVGDIASEHVFLSRAGDGDLAMAGWQLEDEDGNIFLFPQLTLFRDGAVNVWSTSGNPTYVDLYWGLSTPVWVSGEKVTLRDAAGQVHTTYTIP